ncbi:hypothetical protein C8F04DRAFT_1244560 [Mycena alexandri]|uniref:Uncharacterized protein n=1 Tax=Mycena alexandri TaxID=1745969 RepID=A0AAD6RX67_9AGAR|nr:hypothetical protein C8F04DRAFT_1244560 [Mycena alexandri]
MRTRDPQQSQLESGDNQRADEPHCHQSLGWVLSSDQYERLATKIMSRPHPIQRPVPFSTVNLRNYQDTFPLSSASLHLELETITTLHIEEIDPNLEGSIETRVVSPVEEMFEASLNRSPASSTSSPLELPAVRQRKHVHWDIDDPDKPHQTSTTEEQFEVSPSDNEPAEETRYQSTGSAVDSSEEYSITDRVSGLCWALDELKHLAAHPDVDQASVADIARGIRAELDQCLTSASCGYVGLQVSSHSSFNDDDSGSISEMVTEAATPAAIDDDYERYLAGEYDNFEPSPLDISQSSDSGDITESDSDSVFDSITFSEQRFNELDLTSTEYPITLEPNVSIPREDSTANSNAELSFNHEFAYTHKSSNSTAPSPSQEVNDELERYLSGGDPAYFDSQLSLSSLSDSSDPSTSTDSDSESLFDLIPSPDNDSDFELSLSSTSENIHYVETDRILAKSSFRHDVQVIELQDPSRYGENIQLERDFDAIFDLYAAIEPVQLNFIFAEPQFTELEYPPAVHPTTSELITTDQTDDDDLDIIYNTYFELSPTSISISSFVFEPESITEYYIEQVLREETARDFDPNLRAPPSDPDSSSTSHESYDEDRCTIFELYTEQFEPPSPTEPSIRAEQQPFSLHTSNIVDFVPEHTESGDDYPVYVEQKDDPPSYQDSIFIYEPSFEYAHPKIKAEFLLQPLLHPMSIAVYVLLAVLRYFTPYSFPLHSSSELTIILSL